MLQSHHDRIFSPATTTMTTHSNGNGCQVDPIQATIWHCLNNYAYDDAIFLAERLVAFPLNADDPPEATQQRLHLLATAHFRAGNKLQCYELLTNSFKSIQSLNYKCRFLLATAAVDLNKLTQAETALLSSPLPQKTALETIERNYNEISSFALKLYGRICMATERNALARDAYSKALKLNPFLFEAFEQLCKLERILGKENSGDLELPSYFQTGHLSDRELAAGCHGATVAEDMRPPPTPQLQQQPSLGILINRNNTRNNNRCHRNLFTSTPNNNFGTPPSPHAHNMITPTPPLLSDSNSSNSLLSPIIISEAAGAEPKPKKPCLRTVSSPHPQQQLQLHQSVGMGASSGTGSSSVRRSSRLFSGQDKSPSLKENTKDSNQQKNNPAPTTATRKKLAVETSSSSTRSQLEKLLSQIQQIAMATAHLSRYECRQAIEILSALKPSQQNTPYVLATVARAFFEMGEYEQAVIAFSQLYQLNSTHKSLTYYSSSLWHLQKETELSTLSQQLLAEPSNKSLATTWIVLGNCFSLQKEHEQSIRFFKRAIQIAPSNASASSYAYTLLGHEYVATDELDKAMRCFRASSRMDGSAYNCWYGIGMIYYKQERFEEAELYYNKARKLNKGSSILLCHLGVVQNALHRPDKSLNTFAQALQLNKNDPLCKFHRASVLFAVNRLDEALEELEELKRIVPKESLVHFLIAKIHSKRGDTHKALLHFSWATDLDPKGANNHIKENVLNNAVTNSEDIL